MKTKIILLLFAILNVNVLLSQSKDFPSVSATWIYNMGDSAPTTYNRYFSLYGDSLINGITYQKFNGGSNLLGHVRTENKKVFYLPNSSTESYLIYDFSLVEGDTFISHVDISVNGMNVFYVDKVDSILTKDGYRKTWSFKNSLGSAYDYWIEGIGVTYSHPINPILGEFAGYDRLICFSNEGESIIQDTIDIPTVPLTLVSCNGVIVSTKEPLNSGNQLKISPNPFTHQFEILSPNVLNNTPIHIFSLSGKLIQITTYQDQITLPDLSAGTYLLSFRLEQKVFTSLLQKL